LTVYNSHIALLFSTVNIYKIVGPSYWWGSVGSLFTYALILRQ